MSQIKCNHCNPSTATCEYCSQQEVLEQHNSRFLQGFFIGIPISILLWGFIFWLAGFFD